MALLNGNYENTYFAIGGIEVAMHPITGTQDGVKVQFTSTGGEQLTPAQLDEAFGGSFPGWEAEQLPESSRRL